VPPEIVLCSNQDIFLGISRKPRGKEEKKMLIGEIEKNDLERVRISVQSFKGGVYLDIRTYFHQRDNDDWIPTRKGVSIPIDNINDLMKYTRKARDSWQGKKVRE
jgi:hypothetical protein